MYKLVALYVLLTLPLVDPATPKETVIEFCELILLQTKNDTTYCSNTPGGYKKTDGDDAIITYLCCLGCFNDVTYIYMPFLEDEFAQYISSLKNGTLLLNIAKFVKTCNSNERKLGTPNFQSWMANTSCPPI